MKTVTKAPAKPTKKLERTKLEILDIPVEDLLADEDNPNEMDEATFDQLLEEIKEQGFDEPIIVRPHPTVKGKWQIGSGHHRTKAAIVLGMETVPAVIKHWTDREQKVALVKRNALRGDLNKGKLVKIYRELSKGKDGVQVQRELGFTNQKKFEAMYDEAMKTLTPKQKKKLAEAKEKIKSMDDLSSVLNKIFKDSGSELDEGYIVFSFGGKNHHYFQIDKDTEDALQSIIANCKSHDMSYREAMKQLVEEGQLRINYTATAKPEPKKPAVKKKPKGK